MWPMRGRGWAHLDGCVAVLLAAAGLMDRLGAHCQCRATNDPNKNCGGSPWRDQSTKLPAFATDPSSGRATMHTDAEIPAGTTGGFMSRASTIAALAELAAEAAGQARNGLLAPPVTGWDLIREGKGRSHWRLANTDGVIDLLWAPRSRCWSYAVRCGSTSRTGLCPPGQTLARAMSEVLVIFVGAQHKRHLLSGFRRRSSDAQGQPADPGSSTPGRTIY
jgi:hypothetical protein